VNTTNLLILALVLGFHVDPAWILLLILGFGLIKILPIAVVLQIVGPALIDFINKRSKRHDI
jgi:hypothetical protein